MKEIRTKRSNQQRMQFLELIKDYESLGRIVNGLAIEQAIVDGSLKMENVVTELMNFKKSITFDTLEKENVGGLSDDLAKFVTVIKEGCGENGEACSGLDAITKGITDMENHKSKPVKDYGADLEDGSSLQVLVKFKNSLVAVEKAKTIVTNIVAAIDKINDKNITDSKKLTTPVGALIDGPGKLQEIMNIFSNKFTPAETALFQSDNLKNRIGAIVSLGDLNQSVDFSSLSKKLTSLDKAITQIIVLFSKENMNKIEKKMQLVVDTSGLNRLSISDKVSTHGFPNGFSDVFKLASDLESTFAKDILMKGANTDFLKRLLSTVLELEKQWKSFQSTMNPSNARNVIKTVEELQADLELAKQELKNYDSLKPFENCIRAMSLIPSDATTAAQWVLEQTLADNFDFKQAIGFAANFNRIDLKYEEFSKLSQVLTENSAKNVQIIRSYPDLPKVKTELKTLLNKLNFFNKDSFAKWTDNTKIENLVTTDSEWLNDKKLTSVVQCAHSKQVRDDAKKAVGTQSSFTGVIALNSNNKNIVAVSKAAITVKDLVGKMKGSSRKTRETKTVPKLKDGMKTSKDLNGGFNILINLKLVQSLQSEIGKLVQNYGPIDAAIQSSNNAEVKKELSILWTPQAQKTVKESTIIAATVFKMNIPRPHNLSGYSLGLNVTLDFKGNINVDMAPIVDKFLAINAPYPDQSAAEKLRNLQLTFANGESLIKLGFGAILNTVTFFDAFSVQSKKKEKEDAAAAAATSEDSSIILIGCITGAALFSIGGVVGGYGLYWWKHHKEVPVAKNTKVDHKIVVDKKGRQVVVIKKNIPDFCAKKGNKTPIESEEEESYKEIEMPKKMKKYVERKYNAAANFGLFQEIINKEIDKPAKNRQNFNYPYFSPRFFDNLKNVKFEDVLVECKVTQLKYNYCDMDYIIGKGYATFEEPPTDERQERTSKIGKSQSQITLEPTQEDSSESETKISDYLAKLDENQLKTVEMSEKKLKITPSRVSAGADKRRKKKKKRNSETIESLLAMIQRTPRQVLERYGKAGPYKDDLEFYNVDYSSVFYDHRIKENGALIVSNIASGMFRKKWLEIEGWPHKTDNKEAFYFHMPLNDCITLLQKASVEFDKDPDYLKINRPSLNVCGDIHGNIRDFASQMALAMENDKDSILCLGDYVDRGARSVDVVLMIAVLKIINPQKFHFLFGNHEMPKTCVEYGFLEECQRTFGDNGGAKFWEETVKMFSKLPQLAIYQNKVMLAHGGVTKEMGLGREAFLALVKKSPTTKEEARVYLNLKWADPREIYYLDNQPIDEEAKFIPPERQGYSVVEDFTQYGLLDVSKKCDLLGLVRGHQVQDKGLSRFAGSLGTTVFSATNTHKNNWGAQLRLTSDFQVRFVRFINQGDEKDPEDDEITETN